MTEYQDFNSVSLEFRVAIILPRLITLQSKENTSLNLRVISDKHANRA